MSNYKIIAIEGIDRIGKSSFISELHSKIKDKYNPGACRIEKPTIGLNTLHKNEYPLKNVLGIMEMRNIGLFEELLFQVKHHIDNHNPNTCIIRDRFNLSELAYGWVMRKHWFGRLFDTDFLNDTTGFKIYEEWNSWFENQLEETGADIYLISFVLKDEYTPNKDEVKELTQNKLKTINSEFRIQHDNSKFKKKLLIELEMDDLGQTDIFTYMDDVINFVTNGSFKRIK